MRTFRNSAYQRDVRGKGVGFTGELDATGRDRVPQVERQAGERVGCRRVMHAASPEQAVVSPMADVVKSQHEWRDRYAGRRILQQSDLFLRLFAKKGQRQVNGFGMRCLAAEIVGQVLGVTRQ